MLLRPSAGEPPLHPARSAMLHVAGASSPRLAPDRDEAIPRAPLRRLQVAAPRTLRDRISAALLARPAR